MEIKDWFVPILSCILAIISALVTTHLASKKERASNVLEKREEDYRDLIDVLQIIKDNPSFAFSTKSEGNAFSELQKLRSKINLYASPRVLDLLKPLYDRIKTERENYLSSVQYSQQS